MRLVKKLVCALFLLCVTQPVTAGTITLTFEAEITTVAPGIPFEAGIEFEEGDIIAGQFTFEPVQGDGGMSFEAPQSCNFILWINGFEFIADGYQIDAVNDSPISDFPLATVIDSLELGAGGLRPAKPEALPAIDAVDSHFRMTLYGASDAVDQAGVPAGLETWNRFDLRKVIAVSLRDGDGGVVGFQATVGEFSIVPEPSALKLLTLAILALLVSLPTIARTRR